MIYYHKVLSIAGSDSGGGAGIQADLKTFSALGCYGMTAITALTAQNTVGVQGIYPVDAEFVGKQIDSVFEDIGANAVKIGMLGTVELIATVAHKLLDYKVKDVVLDPVMVAKSGDKLLENDAIDAIKDYLFPLARVVTPNQMEATELTGVSINSKDDMLKAAKKMLSFGCSSVYLKGSYYKNDEIPDLYCDHTGYVEWFKSQRIETKNNHGTGCTLSSAIASYIAKGYTTLDAVIKAKEYITHAILAGSSMRLGKGKSPVKHFYKTWE